MKVVIAAIRGPDYRIVCLAQFAEGAQHPEALSPEARTPFSPALREARERRILRVALLQVFKAHRAQVKLRGGDRRVAEDARQPVDVAAVADERHREVVADTMWPDMTSRHASATTQLFQVAV